MSRLAPLLALLSRDPTVVLEDVTSTSVARSVGDPEQQQVTANVTLPVSPREATPAQQRTVYAATKDAARDAEAAVAAVEALFDSPEVRGNLSEYCPSIADASAEELTRRFRAEAAAAELIANFVAAPGTKNSIDGMSLDVLEANGYWPSQWEMMFAGGQETQESDAESSPAGNAACLNSSLEIGNAAEVALYGFPEFKNGACKPVDFDDSVTRPLYTAVNTMRIDVGNPSFGDVSLVWRRNGFAADAAIVAFADTGLIEFMCNPNLLREPPPKWIAPPDCSVAYAPTVDDDAPPEGGATPLPPATTFGTVYDTLMLVPPASTFHAGREMHWLAAHACRTLSTKPWGDECPLFSNQTLDYWEAVVAKPAYAVPHVRFVVATFSSLFGDENYGNRLRKLCLERGWILAWARGADAAQNGAASKLTADVPRHYNRRLVDPATLVFADGVRPLAAVKANATAALDVFEDHWRKASDLRNNFKRIPATAWNAAYTDLAAALPTALATLWPLSARDGCPDLDDCVGTVQVDDAASGVGNDGGRDRTCLCYHRALVDNLAS